MFANSGEATPPCGVPRVAFFPPLCRRFPRSSVSSTGAFNHILLRCSMLPSLTRRATLVSSSECGIVSKQIRVATRGALAEKLLLFDSFAPEKRRQIVRAVPPQALMDLPDLRREAMADNHPQQLVNTEQIKRQRQRLRFPIV